MTRFHGWPRLLPASLVGPVLILWAVCLAGAADADLARRIFDNADQLLREGKAEQALRDFEQIFNTYPDSEVADDALYRVGSYYYPAESVEALGTAPEGALLKARDLLQKVKTKYPSGDHAPLAQHKLGLIALDPINPQRSLDEAYGAFSSVVNVYPASAEVDRALFGAGYADYLSGRYDKAMTSFERVAEDFPRGPVAQSARYHMGLAWMNQGSWVRALEEFQALRNLHPDGSLAPLALDRLTQIYKMKVQRGVVGKPLFAHDPAYTPAIPPDAARADTVLAVDSTSALHLLDTRTGTVYRFDHAGKLASTARPLEGAISMSVDRAGTELLASRGRLKAGSELISLSRTDGSTLRPLENITAAVHVGVKDIALLDEDRNEVLLYTGDPAKLKVLYRDTAGRARLTGLAQGAGGKLYTLDRRGRRLVEISPEGAFREIAVPTTPDQGPLEPVALAADDIGDLYLLDRRAGAVVVLTVDGKLVERIVSQAGTGTEFSTASGLAVGPRAEIYVHDAKRRTILRFR